jgi:hypothetical protein
VTAVVRDVATGLESVTRMQDTVSAVMAEQMEMSARTRELVSRAAGAVGAASA